MLHRRNVYVEALPDPRLTVAKLPVLRHTEQPSGRTHIAAIEAL
jgi:hypothetical protein